MQSTQNQLLNTDYLHLLHEHKLTTHLEPNESLKLTTNINKYNYSGKCQQRILLVTNTSILNVEKTENVLKSLMKKFINFQNKYIIKRRIPIVNLYGITITPNRKSGVFLIHVQNEYDYYYEAETNKMVILKIISEAYRKLTNNQLPFYLKDQSIIVNYMTTKACIKEKKQVKPKDRPVFLNDQYFFERKFEGEYICQFSCDNRKICPNEFKRVEMKDVDQEKTYYVLHQEFDRSINVELLYKSNRLVTPSYSFYSNKKQILFIPFIVGGNLKNYFQAKLPLEKDSIIFYMSQMVNFLMDLHESNRVYGNLTLENIFMKANGYLVYNGLQKSLEDLNSKKLIYKIYGNPYYFSPQVITCKGHSFSNDVWRLGIIFYYLSRGHFPFYGNSLKELYSNIINNQLDEDTPHLIRQMLCKDPQYRITLQEIKQSEQFSGINWSQLCRQKTKAPSGGSLLRWVGKMPVVYWLSVTE